MTSNCQSRQKYFCKSALYCITLIDILYEKNKPLLVTSKSELKLISSSKNLEDVFKRTISRLYELTSVKYN